MTLPTLSETYIQLLEHLRKSQEAAALMGHLHNTEDSINDRALARGWLAISEHFKLLQRKVTTMAQGRLN